MTTLPSTLYAHWREQALAAMVLHDTAEPPLPPERLLQAVWYHQRLQRQQLRTLDGRPLRVLHPGFPNREAGPDFRGAIVQFGDASPLVGDVEVDLLASHWHAHRHDQNPDFSGVVLQAIWDATGAEPAAPPALVLKPFLDAPLEELQLWLGSDSARSWPPEVAGQCFSVLGAMETSRRCELMRQAARTRLEAKAMQFKARARQVGWEQTLWEGLFRALGYRHNAWAMQRLAELLPVWLTRPPSPAASHLAWQARLLGVGGLLPSELPRASLVGNRFLRTLWDCWWRERDALSDQVLPRCLWRLHGLRPVNHPQRRLALAASWLAAGDLIERLESWFARSWEPPQLLESLRQCLQAGPDEFWTWHWTLTSRRSSQARPWIGSARITDLAVNVVLPWFWMRAVASQNEPSQLRAETRYFAWPKGEDNVVLRLARQRMLGATSSRGLRTAADQQGLLQMVRDFCDQSNALCAECRFPELLRRLES